jgi:hypothetical protein
VYVGRPPGIVVIAPGVTSWLDRDEAVATFIIGESAAQTGEVRVERSIVLVQRMQVSPGGVRLPEFHQRAPNRPGIFIEHSSRDNDPFAHRRLLMLASEIDDGWANVICRELGPGDF